MPKKSNKEEFITKVKAIHNNEYDYSLVEYVNNRTKVKIICKIHGIFEQNPNNHLNGQHCPNCGFSIRDNKLKDNIESFVNKANLVHDQKYDYSQIVYIDSRTKIRIICKNHGIFEQTPSAHLQKAGCNRCVIEKHTKDVKLTKPQIVSRFIKINKDRYDYSLVNYVNATKKIKIICKKHGIFEQIPHNHLNGQHCPKCFCSKGVNEICRILESVNIHYETEQKIEGCVSDKSNHLRFDIHLPKFNTYIEFDGEQHFKPVEIWGGEKAFQSRINRDNIKNEFCLNNNIKLIRISYLDNIKKEMDKIISSLILGPV